MEEQMSGVISSPSHCRSVARSLGGCVPNLMYIRNSSLESGLSIWLRELGEEYLEIYIYTTISTCIFSSGARGPVRRDRGTRKRISLPIYSIAAEGFFSSEARESGRGEGRTESRGCISNISLIVISSAFHCSTVTFHLLHFRFSPFLCFIFRFCPFVCFILGFVHSHASS